MNFRQLIRNKIKSKLLFESGFGLLNDTTDAIGIATTPPMFTRSTSQNKKYMYAITRIVFVKKGTADEYIKLLDYSKEGQENSINQREKLELSDVIGYYGLGNSEKEAKQNFWQNWKADFPDILLIIDHQPQNNML